MHLLEPLESTIQKHALFPIGVLGLNFKTASLEIREKISRTATKIKENQKLIQDYSIILLCTCNRTEIYFSSHNLNEAKETLLTFFQHTDSFYTYFGIDALAHLCTVTAGLDSAILAETDIQRQVKLAYIEAATSRKLPSITHFFFQKALHIGKLARNKMAIEKGTATLYGTIWRMAEQKFGNVAQIPILLIGYSEINRGFISFLSRKNIKHFTLITNDPSQIKCPQGTICSRDHLIHWRSFSLILCATKAEGYLIENDGTSTQLIFDLSVPRIVKPSIQHVELWNMEQLHQKIKKLNTQETSISCNCHQWIRQKAETLAHTLFLKLGISRESGERDHIPDIFHTCSK